MKDAFGNEFTDSADTTNPAIRSATISTHAAIDSAAAKAKPALEKAASMAHDAADKTAGWLDEKGAQLSESEKKLINYVNDNPLKAVGMAVVAGALLARII